MDFQVQGSVLVDGEWVSRSADVYHIMSSAQLHEDVDMDDVATAQPLAPPEIGILSKTVINSPLYTTIIPANIRHKDVDDVVFVGEDFVQLKEICDYGHLRHVATKSDFKGKILAARAFGNPRKVQINTSEQNPLLKRTSLHRPRRSTTGEEMDILPLEVIVLTLSTRTLMFLWARDSNVGPATFVQKTIQLPTSASRFNRPGQFLSIDPRCRAIAVAAAEGCFMLYKTKTMDIWRRDLEAGRDEVPVVEEAQFAIDGRIMHMEFLSPGTDDDPHVILIFIIVHEGNTKVASFDWDFRNTLGTPSRPTRSVLDFENRNPPLLIPLSRGPDFILVQSEYISVCKGVLAGPPVTSKTSIPARFLDTLRPGNNKNIPLWVQWDRAPRNPGFAKEAFYLAREDGMILYVELGGNTNLLEISDAGSWPCPIDTAFACLRAANSEFAQSYPDVLVAGGLGSDGHLCKVGAWPKEYANQVPYPESLAFDLIESLPSWAPVTDMAVAPLENIPLPYDRTRASVFVSNGKSPYGEVSQLRRGIRALVDGTFGGMEGSTGLWIVDHGSTALEQDGTLGGQDYATYVVNVPGETLVFRASRTKEEGLFSQGGFGSARDGGVLGTEQPVQDGLIRNMETVSACPITESHAVQVTHHEARVVLRPHLSLVDSITFRSPLLGAATKSGVPYIVVAVNEGAQTFLQTIHFRDDGSFRPMNQETGRHLLIGDPTCIEILVSNAVGPLVFVGTTDAGFSLFAVKDQNSLVQIYHTPGIPNGPRELQHVYESAVLLTAHEHEKLLCGTRIGMLIAMDLAKLGKTHPNLLLRHSKEYSITKMGSTAVYITPNKIDDSMAFLACGADFCRVHLSIQDFEIHIDSIWLHDPSCPTYMQGAPNAVDQVPLAADSGQDKRKLGGFILAVFGDRMVYARLDYDITWSGQVGSPSIPEKGKVIPRKLPISSTPTNIMVAEDLPHHMIVVTNVLREEHASIHKYRKMVSSIRVIDLLNHGRIADADIKEELPSSTPKKKLEHIEVPLNTYERVHSMVRWVFLGNEDRQHALVVVGTGVTEAPGKETGRRLVLNVGKTGLKLQDSKRFPHPVRCIAVYDNQHIVSIIGTVLQIEQIERTQVAKWKIRSAVHLPSNGVDMTVSEDFIYVSTSHDSHLCFRVTKLPEPNEHERAFELTQVFSDSRQRPSLHHLLYTQTLLSVDPSDATRTIPTQFSFVLLTDKNASVTCLFHPLSASRQDAASTLFEACLPRSIIRLERGNTRPPWRRSFTMKYGISRPSSIGVVDDDFIGACTDGTIYNFAILTDKALHLLRLLQHLIEAKQKRDPTLQFSTVKKMSGHIYNLLQNRAEGSQDGDIKARDVDPAVQGRGPAAPRLRHVDGDLLGRFFEQGGNLKRLVEEGCEEDVGKLFVEKTQWLFQMLESVGVVVNPEERMATVEEWVKELLLPLL
ncbi:hypothetical protein BU23DRAFT_455784 [Bimuria novae-zelandiae CBS 107.79]|uniref:RSE1/DDB1/CPSF1 first beta-propeller domain-containing protein n=1 Tax=Bimuria novae-zelandiae CBS 107.79 TaxID=1447943 RepID=A0A6A5VIV5_9PLEO|nr:hypothetical protein BU23DRAFT_455784 [Bimuria novae-zelandiae CBS 107.79]